MPSQLRRVSGWVIAAVAVGVIVTGLWPDAAAADPEVRLQQLSQRIACPWCQGQALAESDNQVAQDLLVLIGEQIEDGWSDGEIYDYYAAKYGEQVILDPPLSGWGVALWATPAVALVAGGWVIWRRQRVTS